MKPTISHDGFAVNIDRDRAIHIRLNRPGLTYSLDIQPCKCGVEKCHMVIATKQLGSGDFMEEHLTTQDGEVFRLVGRFSSSDLSDWCGRINRYPLEGLVRLGGSDK